MLVLIDNLLYLLLILRIHLFYSLVIWDNRCMLHRAMPYDPKEVRILRGTRISGDVESESSLPAPSSRQVLKEAMGRLARTRQPRSAL